MFLALCGTTFSLANFLATSHISGRSALHPSFFPGPLSLYPLFLFLSSFILQLSIILEILFLLFRTLSLVRMHSWQWLFFSHYSNFQSIPTLFPHFSSSRKCFPLLTSISSLPFFSVTLDSRALPLYRFLAESSLALPLAIFIIHLYYFFISLLLYPQSSSLPYFVPRFLSLFTWLSSKLSMASGVTMLHLPLLLRLRWALRLFFWRVRRATRTHHRLNFRLRLSFDKTTPLCLAPLSKTSIWPIPYSTLLQRYVPYLLPPPSSSANFASGRTDQRAHRSPQMPK